MTRSRAMQFSALTAAGTFLVTVLAVWTITQAGVGGHRAPAPTPENVLTPAPIERAAATDAQSDNLRDTNDVRVYKAVKDAVVNITSSHTASRLANAQFRSADGVWQLQVPVQVPVQLQSLGSGFVIHSAGYIITNEHVVEQGTDIECVFDNGDKLSATVVATDNEHDLAVLKVNPPKPLVALPLGASEDLMIGEPVYAIGNPFGFAGTMTRGIVSALDRTLDVAKDKSYKGLIQTDASINPGNSGGPLINAYGQVIGINTAIRAGAEGIGFAINVSSMRDLLPIFLNPEALDRAQVGISLREIRSIASPSHVTATVVVKQVQPGSAADKAGIMPGDRLVNIDDVDVHTIIDALVPIANAIPGDTLSLKFTRPKGNDSRTTIDATIVVAKPTPPDATPIPPEATLLAKMGIKGQTVTPELASTLKLPINQGVYIVSVEPNSPAAITGVQAGDVLLQIDRYRVNSIEDVATLLKSVKGPVAPLIGILRGTQLGRGTIALNK